LSVHDDEDWVIGDEPALRPWPKWRISFRQQSRGIIREQIQREQMTNASREHLTHTTKMASYSMELEMSMMRIYADLSGFVLS
jgi:hypothetical protein